MPPSSSVMVRKIVILGSTGSIGQQTLDVVRSCRDRIEVYGLAAHRNIDLLAEQAGEFRPRAVAIEANSGAWRGPNIEVIRDPAGLEELVSRPEVDLVVVGSAGSGGLAPTMAALRAGKLVALANKETLVSAGSVIKHELLMGTGELVPIDSEHSAIWQCLQGESLNSVEQLTLTASGGALRDLAQPELVSVTPDQALMHPTWSMGRKITVDSANLMNKGLEAIEARWLFDVPLDKIDIVLHPQSIIHSLVTFVDGSTKAQLGYPDMRLPIQYALSHPERWVSSLGRLETSTLGSLTFGLIDMDVYPALRLAIEAGRLGGTYPAVLCAADEIAVEAFLSRRIRFTDIPPVVEAALEKHSNCPNPRLDDILEADIWAREMSERMVARWGTSL
jgi:1-deoxy-D-xylulose-5-phosphate reductoisomerase